MQNLEALVKTATTFLVFISSVIGIPVAFFALKKSRLEIRKLEAELGAAKRETAVGTQTLNNNSSSRKLEQKIKNERRKISLLIVLGSSSMGIIVLIALAPILTQALPKNWSIGWPGGTLLDSILRAAYIIIPHAFSIVLSDQYNAIRSKKASNRGDIHKIHSTPFFKTTLLVGYLASFCALILLGFVERKLYSAQYIFIDAVFYSALTSVLPAISAVFVSFSNIAVYRQSYLNKFNVAASFYVALTPIITFVTFSQIYSYERYNVDLSGAVAFGVLSTTVFAVLLTVCLYWFGLKRAK
jgi:hypothetical protein